MKLLVADDHGLFREGLRYLLAEVGDPLEVLEAADCRSALCCAAQHTDLDLVLLDLDMPDMSGFAALEQFGENFPELPIVILSAETQRKNIERALALGAMGFIPKQSTGPIMIQALRLILAGGIYVPPALLGLNSDADSNGHDRLTERQTEVLGLLAQGQPNKEIGRNLNLAEATVKMHVTAILRALNVSNRTEAVLVAEQRRLI